MAYKLCENVIYAQQTVENVLFQKFDTRKFDETTVIYAVGNNVELCLAYLLIVQYCNSRKH